MTKIPMNKLTAKTITLEETNELLAAVETFRLRQLEFELHQKALKEADEALDAAIAESLKHIPLKWMEGELVKVTDYNRLYCYLDDKFTCIHIDRPPEVINEGIL
jgi:hypothetical protein